MFKLTVRSIRIISYVTLTAFLAAIIVVARTPVEAALQGMDQGAGLGARGNSGPAPQARREIDRTTIGGAVAAPAVKPNYWSVPLHVRATLPGVVATNARITLTPNYWSVPLHVRASLPGATMATHGSLTPNYWSVPLHVRATLPSVVATNAPLLLTPNYWSVPFHVRATLVDPMQ